MKIKTFNDFWDNAKFLWAVSVIILSIFIFAKEIIYIKNDNRPFVVFQDKIVEKRLIEQVNCELDETLKPLLGKEFYISISDRLDWDKTGKQYYAKYTYSQTTDKDGVKTETSKEFRSLKELIDYLK